MLAHEVHYSVPGKYKGAAVILSASVEEAEAVFRAEVAPILPAEAKIVKVVVPLVLLAR